MVGKFLLIVEKYLIYTHYEKLNLVLLNPDKRYSAFANSVDADQLASEEVNWSGDALIAIQYVNLYQQSGSSNLTGWKLEMGVAS